MVILPWYDKQQLKAKEKPLEPLGAAYPKFGVTNTWTYMQVITNYIRFQYAAPTANGAVKSLTAYVFWPDWGGPTNMKAALYQYVSSSNVGNLLATTNEITHTSSYNGWKTETFTFSTNYLITNGTNYYMAIWAGGVSSTAFIGYYTGGNGDYSPVAYGAWPDPITGETDANRQYAMYVTYDRAPTQSTPGPTNSSTGISLTPRCNITVGDPDGDTMTLDWYYNTSAAPTTWISFGHNASVANGTYRQTASFASANSQKYYWKCYVNDGQGYNISAWYCFTTEAPPAQEKTWQSLYNSTLTGGNITTIYRSLFTSLLSGGNITTIYRALFTSTLTGGNVTSTYKPLFTSTLTGGNISTTKSLFTSLLTGGNSTSGYRSLFTSLLTGGNITTGNKALFTSLLTGGNISTNTSLFTSLLTGGNISSDKSLFTSLLTGGNITNRYVSLFTSLLTGGNISLTTWVSLFTSTLTGGNISTNTSLFTSLLTGGNISLGNWTSLFTSLLTGGNITTVYHSFFTSLLTGGNISLGNWTSLFTSTLTGGNISSNHSFFTSLLSGGNVTSPHSLWTSLLTGGNTSVLSPATPYNLNLLVINPNPGNGTHNTNYLKSNASGLTTSIDIFYENFTTPAAYMPGTYSMTIIGTTPANTPVLWNASAVYATVHDTPNGIITPGNPYVGQYYLNPNYDIFRSFLMFDTSVIPDEAIVTGAYVQLVIFDDYSDDDFNVTLQETKSPVPHNPLIITDYFKNGFSGHFGHTNTTGYADEDIFNITLTPLGAAFIKKTSSTAYGVRSDQDINSSAPTGDEFVIFYGYGVATAKYPKLIVNFTIPNSNWEHFVNLTWLSNSSGAWTEYYKSYVSSNGTTTVPAINFSGIDSYFWHLEWESNHTNNGSSQVFTFTTVNVSSGSGTGFILILKERDLVLSIMIGITLSIVISLMWRRKRKSTE